MRFDDMIATVLERPSGHPEQRAAQWRQLVDLLAQRREGDAGELTQRAFDFLRKHRDEVDARARERTAAALAGLPVSPALLAFFAEDRATIAAPLLRNARLRAQDWIDLLPSMTPTSRAVLRHRRDLPASVRQALTTFGTSDFVLEAMDRSSEVSEPSPSPADAPPPLPSGVSGRSQIRDLVERIEAFQRTRDAGGKEASPEPPVEEFRWESGVDGVILWVEGAPRGPLVGQSIAAIAERGQHGVDGQAAGAFHKRAPFRDARFSVAGDGAVSGDWRISGVPFFEVHRGTFLGYRGTARRPRLGEVAVAIAAAGRDDGLFGTNLPPDSLRQLVHELRTPLNAIIGFAEMIEGQYMGPAGTRHRGRAHEIVDQARRLLAAVDDLDAAARSEPAATGSGRGEADLASLLLGLHQAYQREANASRATVAIEVQADLPRAAMEPAAGERMLSRLLAATTGLAQPDETIKVVLRLNESVGAAKLRLQIDRPRAIAGLDELSLLHPGYSPDGEWPEAPALGLGFALRLVRKLAEAAGGELKIDDARFLLHLPLATPELGVAADADRNGGGSA